MSEPIIGKQSIQFGDGHSEGVLIQYTRSRRTVHVSGWYDSMVGIEGGSIGLAAFLGALGISERDCRAAFKARGDE